MDGLVLVVQAPEGFAQHASFVCELFAFQVRREVLSSQTVPRGRVCRVRSVGSCTKGDVFQLEGAVVMGDFDGWDETIGEFSVPQLVDELWEPLDRLTPHGFVERTHTARDDGDLHIAVVVPMDSFPYPRGVYVCRRGLWVVLMQ